MNHKSIQILRGSKTYDPKTSNEVLLDGQPFYSKKTNKLYIGDGSTAIRDLHGTEIGLDYVSTKKTSSELKSGDTIFKGETIDFDGKGLINYFQTYTPKITRLYLVDKDTEDGFRIDCYIKEITQYLKYELTVKIYYVEGWELTTIYDGQPQTIYLNNYSGIETSYSLTNTFKDINNLYMYYTSSDTSLVGRQEGLISGVTIQKSNISEEDILVNNVNDTQVSVDHYVKFKKTDNSDDTGRLVQVVGDKEIPIANPSVEKIDELENKVNNSHVVEIQEFLLVNGAWPTEAYIKEFAPKEADAAYICKKDNDLYYYRYKHIKSSVDVLIANSAFQVVFDDFGNTVYTSTKQSYNRYATALQLTKNPKNLSAVSFDLYMTGLGYASSTGKNNRYYPEIAFLNEKNDGTFEVQFSCYDSNFQLKIIRNGKDPVLIGNIPFTNNLFKSRVKIEIKDGYLIAYIDGQKLGQGSLSTICPEIVNLTDVSKIMLGLRFDKTPPTAWYFSNIEFEKYYWEDGYKVQNDTIYVDKTTDNLYRYVNNSNNRPIPNFKLIAENTGAVYAEPALIPFSEDLTIRTGDEIIIKVDTSDPRYSINTDFYNIWYSTDETVALFISHGGAGGSWQYGWNQDPTHYPGSPIDGGWVTTNVAEYSFIYSGPDKQGFAREVSDEGDLATFYIQGKGSAYYNVAGIEEQLDISMLSDDEKLLNQPATHINVGGNTYELVVGTEGQPGYLTFILE